MTTSTNVMGYLSDDTNKSNNDADVEPLIKSSLSLHCLHENTDAAAAEAAASIINDQYEGSGDDYDDQEEKEEINETATTNDHDFDEKKKKDNLTLLTNEIVNFILSEYYQTSSSTSTLEEQIHEVGIILITFFGFVCYFSKDLKLKVIEY
jgi:hypothetical protein